MDWGGGVKGTKQSGSKSVWTLQEFQRAAENLDSTRICKPQSGGGGGVGEGRFGEYGARLHVSLTITFH